MSTFTHSSYDEAQKALQANKRIGSSMLVTWDAGDGWTGEGYFCSQRNRIVTAAVNSSGFKVC